MNVMKKPKHAKPAATAEDKDDALADRLLELALELREVDVYAVLPEPLQKAQAELRRAINKGLQQ
jgi:uroporphyrinogen-III synthase